jgi:hypothetical protein
MRRWRNEKERTAFCARIRNGHFDRPALPADLVIAADGVPRLAPALLEELNRYLAAASAAGAWGWRASAC